MVHPLVTIKALKQHFKSFLIVSLACAVCGWRVVVDAASARKRGTYQCDFELNIEGRNNCNTFDNKKIKHRAIRLIFVRRMKKTNICLITYSILRFFKIYLILYEASHFRSTRVVELRSHFLRCRKERYTCT